MTEQEDKPIPEPTLLDLFQGFFHRQDKLLEYMAETQRQMLALLRTMSGVPPAPPLGVVEISDESIKALIVSLETLTVRLVQLPNCIDRVEIDTSNTDWNSLKDQGKIVSPIALGFWVEKVGGGFDYKIMRNGKGPDKPRTAAADDKWELEFDDLLVKGSATGTAVVWIWWRE